MDESSSGCFLQLVVTIAMLIFLYALITINGVLIYRTFRDIRVIEELEARRKARERGHAPRQSVPSGRPVTPLPRRRRLHRILQRLRVAR